MFRLECAFITKFFFCSGQSRAKLNTEIKEFGRNIEIIYNPRNELSKTTKGIKVPEEY